MKKNIFVLLGALLFTAACTDQESISKANAFWMQQFASLISAKGFSPEQAKAMAAAQLRQKSNDDTEEEDNALFGQFPLQPQQPRRPAKAAAGKKNEPIIEVSMEEAVLPGIAPLQDRVQMTNLLNIVQESNQEILTSFGDLNPTVRNQLLTVTTQTERRLKREAAQAKNFSQYALRQQQLLRAQTKRIEQIIANSFANNNK